MKLYGVSINYMYEGKHIKPTIYEDVEDAKYVMLAEVKNMEEIKSIKMIQLDELSWGSEPVTPLLHPDDQPKSRIIIRIDTYSLSRKCVEGDTKQKYVRLHPYNKIVIFPQTMNHSDFKHLNPISAGFCYVDDGKVSCFGNSHSLKLESMPDDSERATRQIFGK